MKCKKCGSELHAYNDIYVCNNCGARYSHSNNLAKSQTDTKLSDFVVQGGTLIRYKGNDSVVIIPNGVASIGCECFKDNLLIHEVHFSNTVIEIRNNAFEGCINMTTIYGYENIQYFGDDCFRNSGLFEIEIGEKIIKLGKSCFSNMANLSTIVYTPNKILKLDHTFHNCPNLVDVVCDRKYFFPSFHSSLEVKNNSNNKRPTFSDAFTQTPYIKKIRSQYLELIKKGTCPECGGNLAKGLFHCRCKKCGIDYKN